MKRINKLAFILLMIPSIGLGQHLVNFAETTLYTDTKYHSEREDQQLTKLRNTVTAWQEKEDFLNNYNLNSTGVYKLESTERKNSYVGRELLDYLEWRLLHNKDPHSGKVTKTSVGKIHQNLNPYGSSKISQSVKLRYKAKIFRRTVSIALENPYVDAKATIKFNGDSNIHIGKNIESFGLKAEIDYEVSNNQWEMKVRKQLNKNWGAEVNSIQSDKKAIFSNESNKRFQLTYGISF